MSFLYQFLITQEAFCTELGKIQEEIKKNRQKVALAQKRENVLVQELNLLDKELSKKKERVRKLGGDLNKILEKERSINYRIPQIKKRMNKQAKLLVARAVALYKYEKIGLWRVLLSSDNPSELFQRYKFIKLILKRDRELISEYRETIALLEKERNWMEKNKKKLSLLKINIQREKEELQKDKGKKQILLKKVLTEKENYIKIIQELEIASKRIYDFVEKYDKTLDKEGEFLDGRFEEFKGDLIAPLEGRIIRKFGNYKEPRLKTTIFHKGIDIRAPEGSDIRAIFHGRVIYANWFKGYGNIIIIDHGNNYYSLSAHASKILKKTGERVRKGEVVALVGDTASLKGPYLYFEIRYHAKPIDPLKWIRLDGRLKVRMKNELK